MRRFGPVVAVLFLVAGPAAFGQGSITSNNAAYVLKASHWDDTPDVSFTGVGNGNQLYEAGWWFRIEGDTRETVFPPPTTQDYTASIARISWADLGGRGLSVTKTHTLLDLGPGRGVVTTTLSVTNNGSGPITLHLFQMIDLDVNGSAAGDSVAPGGRTIRVTDATAGYCEWRSDEAISYLVLPYGASAGVAALLRDTAVTNFDNTGVPFGPGDFTGGQQWTLYLSPGATGTVHVNVACNMTLVPVTLQTFQVD